MSTYYRLLYHDRLSAALEDVKVKEQAMSELDSQRESWENRCFKLRVYMRKLTAKCEEWETSYEQQSKLLETLNSKYTALKNNRTETLEVRESCPSHIILQYSLTTTLPFLDT